MTSAPPLASARRTSASQYFAGIPAIAHIETALRPTSKSLATEEAPPRSRMMLRASISLWMTDNLSLHKKKNDRSSVEHADSFSGNLPT